MKNILNNIPCHCEHLESEHYNIYDAPKLCEKCFYGYPNSTQWQHIYKPDNLKYLENKYEENSK
jgi:hypothetical protein